MRLSNQLLIATTNRNKFEEFQEIFRVYPDIGLVLAGEIIRNPEKLDKVESFPTYLENAIAKARIANHASHYPSLADDSGIEVDALGGRPGPRSHRYAPFRPNVTQDQANSELLISELKQAQDRKAKFVCTLALVIEGILLHATGILEGTLLEAPRGENGFGYDPLFVPQGSQKTLAEMTLAEKNTISHRAKAAHALMNQAKAHGIAFAKP